jgi:hypothetical protein
VSAGTSAQAPTGIVGAQASQLGPQYLVAGPETHLPVLGTRVGVLGIQSTVSVGGEQRPVSWTAVVPS